VKVKAMNLSSDLLQDGTSLSPRPAKPHRSREALILRALPSALTPCEGAERRPALGCLRGTLRGPVTSARRRKASRLASRAEPLTQSARRGCSPFGAPRRRFVGLRSRADGVDVSSCRHAKPSRPLVVAEGGFPVPPGGRGYEPARRTPHPAPTLARLRRRPR
jgi:hypothetical protein